MSLRGNLTKVIYVSRSVKDAFNTIRSLARHKEDGFQRIDLEFRDGSECKNVSLGAAWMLISYYYWSKKLKSFNSSDLQILHEIGNSVYSKLHDEFNSWPNDLWGLQGTHGIVFMLVRKFKPDLIIETGIAHGYSAEIILSALQLNEKGKLISIDIDKKAHVQNIEVDVGWLVSSSLQTRWDKMTGDSKLILSEIKERPDLFIHDSLHTEEHMLSEFVWAKNHLKLNGFLVSDDIDRNRAWKIFHSNNKEFQQYIKTATTGVSQKVR